MEQPATEIKTIFFDLGKVLVNYDTDILVKGYNKYGKVDKDRYIDYLWRSRDANWYMEGKITSSQFFMRTKRSFKLKIGYNDFYEVWNSMFWPYPEMEEVVRGIKRNYPGIRLILVSNTNEGHFNFIKLQYKVLDLFDEFVLSHEVGKQKPRAEIFRKALIAGVNKPKETFYTDDIEKFIKAARTMGIRAFQFTGHEKLKEDLARFGIAV